MAKFLLFLALLLPGIAAAQSCTTTLNAGSNIATAVSAAASGATICLNDGNYGTGLTLNNIVKTSYVTVRSTNPRGATLTGTTTFNGTTRFIRFQSLRLTGVELFACSRDIQIADSYMLAGVNMYWYGATCTYPANYLIDGNELANLGGFGGEGRIMITDDDGHQPDMNVVISNNWIHGDDGTDRDGIQITGGASGLTIGPNNIFEDIPETADAGHADAMQLYGSGTNILVYQNFFGPNVATFITAHTFTADNVTWRDNVFDGTGDDTEFKIQFGGPSGNDNLLFERNTIRNATIRCNDGIQPTTFRNNIFVQAGVPTDLSIVDCPGSAISYNLFTNGCGGTNCITGTPTFVGGAYPTTWAGWQLATSSLGYQSGSDGGDRGTRYYGSAAGPSAPTNFRLVRPFPWPLIVTELN